MEQERRQEGVPGTRLGRGMALPAARRMLLSIWRALPVTLRSRALTLLAGRGLPRARGCPPGEGPVFVAGHLRAATGLGQSARLYHAEFLRAGREAHAVDLTEELLQTPVPGIETEGLLRLGDLATLAGREGPGTLIIHVNPPVFMLALRLLRPLLPGKRVVAYWAWELMDIPGFWRPALDFVHAVEVPSAFTAAAIRPHTGKPVLVHPHAVPPAPQTPRAFAADGVVRVLAMFDMASNFHRKNPLAAVRAFQLAFGRDSRAQLLLKTSAMDRYPPGRDALLAAIQGWENIRLHERRLPPGELTALYHGHDTALSLHRSEGYGLTIAEALRHGLFAVATGWSGNVDFMRGQARARAVPYAMVPVKDDQGGLNLRGQRWAEADVRAAAAILREVARSQRPDLDIPAPADFTPPPPAPQAGSTAVVLVNYRGAADTLAALAALTQLDAPPRRVAVVDNGSGDGSAGTILQGWRELCRNIGRPEPARLRPGDADPGGDLLLELADNRGFAAGNNAALALLIADAGCRAFWLLNNDALPEPGALSALCARLGERSDAGLCGSLLVRQDDPGEVQAAGGGSFSQATGVTRDLLRGERAEAVQALLPEAVEQRLGFLGAASLLVRRETLEAVGPLDEDFFLYYEDVEFSLRARRAGFALAFAPGSVVRHAEGASTGALRPLVDALSQRNRLLVMGRHFPSRLPLALLRHFASLGLRLARGDMSGAARSLRACCAWARGETGRGAACPLPIDGPGRVL